MNNSKHQYFRPVWTSGRYDKKSHSAIIYNLASGKSYFFEDTAGKFSIEVQKFEGFQAL